MAPSEPKELKPIISFFSDYINVWRAKRGKLAIFSYLLIKLLFDKLIKNKRTNKKSPVSFEIL